jgi:aminomethyltransferase
MPIGTPFHDRTFALCESLNYREWSGYYAVSSYETHHEHEYNAIRNAAALIDISPLFKYVVSGRDAARLVDRVITRDVSTMDIGRVFYTPWCDEQGFVIDDGTVARLAETRFRMTSADPTLRWLMQNARGFDVTVEDVSEQIAALALQGPRSADVLRVCATADVERLQYFRITTGSIAGVPVEISRTGYTGDLGYEIWVAAGAALKVWDAMIAAGEAMDIKPAGMLALDVARVEAGLVLADVDYVSSRKALTDAQKYTPFEMGLGRLVDPQKGTFIGKTRLMEERARGPRRRIVGLEVDWSEVEALYERHALPPVAPAAASRLPVPVLSGGRQVGRATTTAWSPTLKRLIALATIDAPHFATGASVRMEITVEGERHFVTATVVSTPFFNPARKTGTPPFP